jgi:hypothetical protein
MTIEERKVLEACLKIANDCVKERQNYLDRAPMFYTSKEREIWILVIRGKLSEAQRIADAIAKLIGEPNLI